MSVKTFRRLLSTSSTCGITNPIPSQLGCDYLIIGGGPMGSSIAYHLAKELEGKNQRIIVLERDFCYRTASAMLSAGGLRQQFSLPENIRLSMYGAEFIKDPRHFTVPGEDQPIDVQFHENGYLFLAGEKSRQVLVANHQTQHSCGATWIDFIEKNNLQKEFPWLNPEHLDCGTFGRKNEGYFDPWAFVNAMKKKSMSLGVEYIEAIGEGASLQPITTGSSSYTIEAVHFYRQNSRHDVYATNVINAAGAWSGRLLESFVSNLANSKGIKRIPVAPRARTVFGVSCRDEHQTVWKMPPPKTPLTIDPSGVWFRPEGKLPGKFLCGVSPLESEDRDVSTEEEAAALQHIDSQIFEDMVWPVLAELVPAFEQLKVTSSWNGFYDYNTLDQNAIIGPHSEIRNLMLCTGFSGHGLQQGPGAGRAVSELLLNNGKFQTVDVSRFSFERIVNNQPIFETGIV